MNRTRTELTIIGFLIVIGVVLAISFTTYDDFNRWNGIPPMRHVDTSRIEREAMGQRVRRLEVDLHKTAKDCREARDESAMAQSRAVWLRAMLHTMAHRHGRKLPRGLSTWPKHAMEGVK